MAKKEGEPVEMKDPPVVGGDQVAALQNRINDLVLQLDELKSGGAAASAAAKIELETIKRELAEARKDLADMKGAKKADAAVGGEGGCEYGWWS